MPLTDSPDILRAMTSLLGPQRARMPAGAAEAAGGLVVVEPASLDELSVLVRHCEAERLTLAPIGSGRTVGAMRARPAVVAVSLNSLARIVAYEPADMTASVEAGLTLGELNRRLAAHGQRLPLDPARPDTVTIGALIAGAKAGPLRLSEGTARDMVVGIRFVGHGGRAVHGGGTVVKNVAGYDLMKVMTGSFGTLGIITEVSFKVRPVPEGYTLARASFSSLTDAFAAGMRVYDALSPIHLEVVSPGLGGTLGLEGRFGLLAAFCGNGAEIEYQRARAVELFGRQSDFFEGAEAQHLYQQLRDLDFESAALSAQLTVLPRALGQCLEACQAEFRAHVGCGVAQLVLPGAGLNGQKGAVLARWRQAASQGRGFVQVIHASRPAEPELPFFDTPGPGPFALMRRLKAAFDPAGIFNPGCFVGGL
jgi:glycolate oxidase FAD binding subunit